MHIRINLLLHVIVLVVHLQFNSSFTILLIHLLQAMQQANVAPKVQPIRGGTDGAQLSFKGLPCPNIFAGGVNFHGPYEFVSVQVMEKAMQVIINICRLTAEFND